MFSFKNFFTKSEPQKNTPTLNAFAFGGFSALYEINFDAYFRLYENNPYISSAIDRIRSDVGAFGFEIYN
uniref:Helical box domain of E3 ubiquitin-protein ligase HECW1 n=1 Tax=virus sp. ctkyY8 TaxID=2827995 RepID=A0A8S5RDT4_9VIRU|nr:MAG TPA: Helical box domain of E3 ubiquitin-protein ligase HECW1 [virus sp. ctkyY8]